MYLHVCVCSCDRDRVSEKGDSALTTVPNFNRRVDAARCAVATCSMDILDLNYLKK